MSKILIDTDIAIDYLRGDLKAKKLIEPLWFHNTAYLSLLSVYELHAGLRENESKFTQDFIHACNIEPLSVDIVTKAGEYFRIHRNRGFTLTSIDCMIYMTAKLNQLKLLTRNVKHYPDKDILY